MPNDEIDSPLFDLGTQLRLGRRRSDLSQRELAERAGVGASTVARLESERLAGLRLSTLAALLRALGLRVICVDHETGAPLTPQTSESWRDTAGRHLPPHLEPRPSAGPDDTWWWGWLIYSTYAIPPQPTYTYFRSRTTRDRFRRHVDPWRRYV